MHNSGIHEHNARVANQLIIDNTFILKHLYSFDISSSVSKIVLYAFWTLLLLTQLNNKGITGDLGILGKNFGKFEND